MNLSQPIQPFLKSLTQSLKKGASPKGLQKAQQQIGEAEYQRIYSEAMKIHGDTVAHESAHQAAAGRLAGGMTLNYSTINLPGGKSIRYASSGSVALNPPAVPLNADKRTLKSVLSDLKAGIAGALAPPNPSSQDYAVAARLSQQLNAVNQKLKQPKQIQGQANKLNLFG